MTETEKDELRLLWLAATMAEAHDSDARGNLCNWNGTLLLMVLDRFHKWRKEGMSARAAMRRAIDTQVIHEDTEGTVKGGAK